MNISSVKFNGIENNSNVNFGRKQTYRSRINENTADSFETAKKSSNIKKGIIAGLLATATSVFGVHALTSTSNVVNVPYTNQTSISDISNTYGVSENIIIDYNHLNENSDVKELKIPSSYDTLAKKETSLKEKLYKNLSPIERQKVEKELNELKQKREMQKEVADVYCDDDYVYFKLHLDNEENQHAISAEDFKNLFNIESGALKNHNKLDFEWKSDKVDDITGQYQDYTNAVLKDGETYKVRKSNIRN